MQTTRWIAGLVMSIMILYGCSKDVELPHEFVHAEKLWKSGGITHYAYTFHWSCFCVEEYTQEVEIVVENGQITRIHRVSDQAELPEALSHRYYTISGLFSYIEGQYTKRPDNALLEFNSDYGYPIQGWFDYQENMADEEMGFYVRTFKPEG